MVAITGSDTFFTNIDSSFTATKWEACIEQAIDEINGYARNAILPLMTGAAGSKTVTVTSMQAGFIRKTALALYPIIKTAGANSQSIGLGPMSQSSSTSSSSGSITAVEDIAKEAAIKLTPRSFLRA